MENLEIWKKLTIGNCADYYEVSNFGNIRITDHVVIDKNGVRYCKKGYICKITPDKYRRRRLSMFQKDGSKFVWSVDFLVAAAFCPNPNNYDTLYHIDGDIQNDYFENLCWVDVATDSRFRTVVDLDGEEWLPVKDFNSYMVSNFGRIKSVPRKITTYKNSIYFTPKFEQLLVPTIEERSGYLSVGMHESGNVITKRVHRLVAEHFIPNPDNKPDVDHIDHNKQNNCVNNLRWVTKHENNLNGGCTTIIVTFPDGNVVTYPSIKDAAKATGYAPASVTAQCSRKSKPKNGITFRYANEQAHLGQKNRRKGNSFEREVVNKLKALNFNVVTSRSESKRTDDKKIDIVSLDDKLPTNIQTKYCNTTPNYFNIQSLCPDKTKPFTIIWKKSTNDGKNSPGTVAIIPVEFFYELIKPYANV